MTPEQAAPEQRRRPRWLVPALAGAIALALLAVTALVIVPQLLGDEEPTADVGKQIAASEPLVTVTDQRQAPDPVWQLDGPTDMPPDALAGVHQAWTIAQDHALVVREVSSADSENPDLWLTRVNTRTGEELWSTRLEGELKFASPAATMPDADGLLPLDIEEVDGPGFMATIDVAAGEIQQSADLRWSMIDSPHLEGDILARDDSSGAVGRYRAADLTPVWTLPKPAGNSKVSVGGATIVVNDRAYSLDDGSERSWRPEPDDEVVYGDVNGLLFTSVLHGGTRTLARIDEATGDALWTREFPNGERNMGLGPESGLYLLGGTPSKPAQVIRLDDGSTQWTGPTVGSENIAWLSLVGYVRTADIVFPPITHQPAVTGYDAATGEPRVTITLPEEDSYGLLGATTETMYVRGRTDHQSDLHAFDLATGTTLWTLPSPHEDQNFFDVLGGNLVAYAWCCQPAGMGAPAPLIGLG